MKVAVIGSREKWLARPMEVRQKVREYIAALPRDTIIVSGGARGVDSYAAEAARDYGLAVVEYRADWEGAPKYAGHIRNRLIIKQADRVVAFWDGESPGTAGAMKLARGKPLEVYTVERKALV